MKMSKMSKNGYCRVLSLEKEGCICVEHHWHYQRTTSSIVHIKSKFLRGFGGRFQDFVWFTARHKTL